MADSAESVEKFTAWLLDLARTMRENAAYLTELDSAIGDADHGSNLDRGFKAVADVLGDTEFDGVDELMKKAGMTLVSKVGGASGPLYGTFFLRFGTALAGAEITPASVGEACGPGSAASSPAARPNSATRPMYDAWAPALDAYDAAVADGADLGRALQAAAEAAATGRDDTTPLVARKGRASYLGERSAGHQDPGATSTTLLLESAARTLA
jgi:dihydroxyacetone kinase-like protein